MQTSKPPYYRIYLLTIWQERNRGPPALPTWRFRLEDPRTGRQQLFVDAATLLNALQTIAAGNQFEAEEVSEEQGGTK